MKRKAENSTVNYEPEQVSEEITSQFTKTTRTSGISIAGTAKKNGTQVGEIYYNAADSHLVLRLKPLTDMSDDERKAVYKALLNGFEEVLTD